MTENMQKIDYKEHMYKYDNKFMYSRNLSYKTIVTLLDMYTNGGDIVLDPMCGSGVIPYISGINGRYGVGTEKYVIPYMLSRARCYKFDRDSADVWRHYVKKFSEGVSVNPYDYDFFLNFMEFDTLRDLLALRKSVFDDSIVGTNKTLRDVMLGYLLSIIVGNDKYCLINDEVSMKCYDGLDESIEVDMRSESILSILESKTNEYALGTDDVYTAISFSKIDDLSNNISFDIDCVMTSMYENFGSNSHVYFRNWIREWFLDGRERDDFMKFFHMLDDKDYMLSVIEDLLMNCKSLLKDNGSTFILNLPNVDEDVLGNVLEIGESIGYNVEDIYYGKSNKSDDCKNYIVVFGIGDVIRIKSWQSAWFDDRLRYDKLNDSSIWEL